MSRDERTSQVEKALLGLRALILDGQIAANARLPEVALSDRLGISRTPLRQAMDRLVAEGLLVRLDTGGCRVASFTVADIIDAIEIRGVMEGTAARLAAERGADPVLWTAGSSVLDGIDRALSAAGTMDFEAYVDLNAEFHRLVAAMSGSTTVIREVERASQLPLASPSAFLQGQQVLPDFQDSLRRAQGQHRAIHAAIRDREGARAEALAREHARLARQNLDAAMHGDPRLAEHIPGLALVAAR